MNQFNPLSQATSLGGINIADLSTRRNNTNKIVHIQEEPILTESSQALKQEHLEEDKEHFERTQTSYKDEILHRFQKKANGRIMQIMKQRDMEDPVSVSNAKIRVEFDDEEERKRTITEPS